MWAYILFLNPKIIFLPGTHYLQTKQIFIQGHLVLVTKINEPYFDDISDFQNKVIAVSEVSKNIQNLIKIRYPNIKIKLVANLKEGMDLIIKDEVFGLIGFSTLLAYKIQEDYPFELKIMSKLGNNIFRPQIFLCC